MPAIGIRGKDLRNPRKFLREFCGTRLCFVVRRGIKFNGRHAVSC